MTLDPNRRALLIGISTYEDPDIPTLDGPIEDVRSLRRVLSDPGIGRFEVDVTGQPVRYPIEAQARHEPSSRAQWLEDFSIDASPLAR